MVAVLLFAAGFIGYLPVPVLTAIVISALMNVVEWHLAVRLFKVSRKEFYIFVAACMAVLFLGTIYGVIIGIILSFVAVVIRETNPPRAFLGGIPGRDGFYDLNKNHYAHPIENTVIYRFNASLFFANSKLFQEDIENHLKEDTKTVIVDAGTITNIDITAADTLLMLKNNLEKKGIAFYITEHMQGLNTQLRNLGMGSLIEEGCVRRTVHIALKDMGIKRPYPLEGDVDNQPRSASRKRADNRVQEFVWAFGAESEDEIEKQIRLQIEHLKQTGDVDELLHGSWSHMEAMDEDEWLEHLEEHLKEIVHISGKDEKTIARRFEEHRREIHDRIAKEHPELAEKFKERRHLLDEHLKEKHPEVYELVVKLREKDN